MFVSDYVLMGYGTGIVMGVPGHDQRDWEFAKKFGLPIIEVVAGGDVTKEAFVAKDDSAVMVNSGFLNGMTVKEAIPAMKKYVVEQGFGKEKVNYKLRDWVFSRQRYWGEPIPLVHCDKCGWVPVPESELPLVLPQVESYEPTDDGESPAEQDDRLGQHHLPALRRPRQARDRHHAPVGRLELVLPALYGSPQRQGARLARRHSNTGPPSTGTTAAWSTRRSTCSIPASGTSSSMTSASCRRRSPMPSARATV